MASASPELSAHIVASAPSRHGFLFYVGCIVASAVVLFFGSAIISGVIEGVHQKSVANDPNAIRADEQVTLASDAFGCEFESRFAKAVEHYQAQELSAWAKIVTDKPYCFYGESFASKTWTVLQVRDNLMQISSAQFDSELYKHDYWTLAKWAKKVEKR